MGDRVWQMPQDQFVAAGFYEWVKEGGKKVPRRFTLGSGGPFAFAGLWEVWNGDGKPLSSPCPTPWVREPDTATSPVHP